MAQHDVVAGAWEPVIAQLLATKFQNGSRSEETVRKYGSTLRAFAQAVTGKAPDQVTAAEIAGFAYATGPTGKVPSRNTIRWRIAVLSSFYRWGVRRDLWPSNPVDKLNEERPRGEEPPVHYISREQIKALLASFGETPEQRQHRAITLTLLLTGRRRSEVCNLRRADVEVDADGVPWYRYRGKGATNGHRELPRPAFQAILDALTARGVDFETMAPDARLFSLSVHGYYRALQRAFKRASLDVSGVHVLRHSYARMLRELGESIEDVSNALDHRSIATTATYLKRLEGQRDSRWRKASRALGIA